MTDFADEAQLVTEAERASAVAEIRRRVAPPVEVHTDCLACADPIEPDRLEANPAARRCLPCQETFERLQKLHPPKG